VLQLPDSLIAVLHRKFSDYRLPTAEDYRSDSPDDSDWAVQRRGPVGFKSTWYGHWYEPSDSALPFVCWGDFDGNGRIDVALMLVPTRADTADPEGAHWRLVIFLGTSGSFRVADHSEVDTWAGPDELIRTRPPGMEKPFSETGDEPGVNVAHESIFLYIWGKAGDVIYWDGSKFQEITIID
jgi:hypothetical protein